MLELTLALIGLALSAFFSGSELAFITANPLQMEVWSKQSRRGAARAIRLMEDPDGFLVSILVGTTLSNVVTTSFATTYLIRQGLPPLATLVIITAAILLFGEILPKTISGERPNHILRLVAPIQGLWRLLFTPLTIPLRKFSGSFGPSGQTGTDLSRGTTLKREDLKLLFAAQKDSQVLEESEKELITQVFDLGETPVSRAMTPRTEICAVSEADDLNKVVHTFIESGYSKLPVYRDNLDKIVGVVYLYDLFKSPPDLASIIRPVTMLPDSNMAFQVFKRLQQVRRSIAIMLDEYGGTAGLVTPEDLFEELFGEFEDEFDARAADAVELPDGSFLTDGKTKVEDLNRRLPLNIPEGPYETVAGYLTASLDRIPHKGERLYLPFGQVVIRKSTPRRIDQVQIFLKNRVESGRAG